MFSLQVLLLSDTNRNHRPLFSLNTFGQQYKEVFILKKLFLQNKCVTCLNTKGLISDVHVIFGISIKERKCTNNINNNNN